MTAKQHNEKPRTTDADNIPCMTFEEFSIAKGYNVSDEKVQSHIHATLRSKPTTKTFARWHEKELQLLQAELMYSLDRARVAYAEAIANGEVRKPSRTERLRKAASGHPDNPSTQAAIRLLSAMSINQEPRT